jgi:tRNA-uridine 2-sulfurtransferase
MQTMPAPASELRLSGRALAAMSGGVDSAVATALACGAGRDAVGVTMRLWSPGDGELSEKVRQCCGPTAYEDARRAAAAIGIPHFVVNFERAFERSVIDYFCAEYLAGRTPNPCVACNNFVKFGALLDFARVLGADTIVTGHYARIVHDDDGTHLLRAVDRGKDQSYMLAGLAVEQLAALVLPLGELSKDRTRDVARERGLDVADKPDSMDLCFVDGDYRGFIARRFPESAVPGPINSVDGARVGTHDGLLNYTVGQRKGLSVMDGAGGPWYVVSTDRASNSVTVGKRADLARDVIDCSNANVVRPDRFIGGVTRGRAVCRYRSAPIEATARLTADGGLRVTLAEPVPMASPGQLLVLYDDADVEVVASGVIAS